MSAPVDDEAVHELEPPTRSTVGDEVALVVGTLRFHLRRPAPAIVALDGGAADGMTLVPMALCRLGLGDNERALEHARAAVALAPDLADAQRLQAWIDAGCPQPEGDAPAE